MHGMDVFHSFTTPCFMSKWLKISLFLGLFVLALAVFVIENVLPYSSIKPWRLKPAENAWRFPNGFMPANFGLKGQEMFFLTRDSLKMCAYFSETPQDRCKGTIIVLHGIASCKETQFQKARILAENGWNTLALDLRAHGESEGQYCTFGHYEKQDIQTAVDTLLARWPALAPKPVGIWGASLGGAIALQAMDWDKRLGFGIVESTFDEFPNVAEEYGADMLLGLRSQWLLHHILRKSGTIAQFDPFSVKPVAAAARIARPMLFIHGDADDKIPLSFNKRNFDAIPVQTKEWIEVRGAGHNNVWAIGGADLEKRVVRFLAGQ